MRKKIRVFLLLNLGTLLMTVGVYFFKIPNGFSTGGVSGIGTLFGKLLPVLSPATWILVINIALLLLGFLFLGKDTGIKTVYCSLIFSLETWLLEYICPLSAPLTDQPLLELIYAILLTAVGSAILFNLDASSGGTDIVALILKKFTNLNVGRALLCTDFLIASSAFFVFGIRAGLFSLLGLFAKAFLVDGVIESINSCKYFIVITEQPDLIGAFIMERLGHGVTAHQVVGEYTHANKTMIHTVCHRLEAARLRKEIRQLDSNAFVIITTTSEIVGRGFRSV